MPQKSLQRRVKRAKREGTRPVLRETDLGTVKSGHAAKKSRSIVAAADLVERHVSRRKAPGEGKAARRQVDYPGRDVPNRARKRMAGTDLRAPKIGSER
jgi:hypothetical protein